MPSGKPHIKTKPPGWLRMQPVWCFILTALQTIAVGVQASLLSHAATGSSWLIAWWGSGVFIGLLVLVSVYGHSARYIRVKEHWVLWQQGQLLPSTLRARVYRDWLYVDTHYRYGRILLAVWIAITGALLASPVDFTSYGLIVLQLICVTLVWCCRRSMQTGFAWTSRIRDSE